MCRLWMGRNERLNMLKIEKEGDEIELPANKDL